MYINRKSVDSLTGLKLKFITYCSLEPTQKQKTFIRSHFMMYTVSLISCIKKCIQTPNVKFIQDIYTRLQHNAFSTLYTPEHADTTTGSCKSTR